MRNSKVSIVMYHYVRDLKYSRYPEIKGLDIALFKGQIKYLMKHYTVITMEMLIDSIDNKTNLPEKSVLLTFDDAYKDHFNFAFPILNELRIQGSFFPPVKAITHHTVLDVNKIHFILAAERDKLKIIGEIKNELYDLRKSYELESFSFYYDKLAKFDRYDAPDVIFIKRLLQVELEESVRNILTNRLFEKIVGIDENSFSKEIYMDRDQVKCMHRNGMHIGSHGYDHYWLGSLTREKQKFEIESSLAFLSEIGCDVNEWTMCYPYGNYNESTIDLLGEFNCKLALTTEVDIADTQKHGRYKLPRLDTNDIPKDGNEATNRWYPNG